MTTYISECAKYAVLPQIDLSTVERLPRETWASIGHPDEDEIVHCRVRLRYDTEGQLHSTRRRGGAVCPSVVAWLYDTVHVEYHRNGLLHNWHGPAIQHGEAVEYWLYGCRFSPGIHALLTHSLDKQRCDTDFGQMRRLRDFCIYRFIDFCYLNNDAAAPVYGKNYSMHQRKKASARRHRAREARLCGLVIEYQQKLRELKTQ